MSKRVNLSTKSIAALLPLLAPAVFAAGQKPNPPIAITISTLNTTIVSGSRIRLDIFTTNSSDQLVVLPSSRMDPEDAGITIRNSEGATLKPRESAPKREGTGSHFGAYIPPGEKIDEALPLDKWFDLTTPGKYDVEVEKRVHGFKGVAKSNTLTITVIPAK